MFDGEWNARCRSFQPRQAGKVPGSSEDIGSGVMLAAPLVAVLPEQERGGRTIVNGRGIY
jgi:hypothetical protein